MSTISLLNAGGKPNGEYENGPSAADDLLRVNEFNTKKRPTKAIHMLTKNIITII